MQRLLLFLPCLLLWNNLFSWGFFAHRKINFHAVFLLPPEMLVLYKSQINFLSEHAIDPDKRRYAVREEGARHFIDMDHYGPYPFDSLPRQWNLAVARYSKDSLQAHGIVPWHIQTMLHRLTAAFREKDQLKILKLSAEIGHYIGDAHVPLHACSNHNGQFTGQHGIHAFWESRIPELLADSAWDLFTGKAEYVANPSAFIWKRVLESAAAADTVLRIEKELSKQFSISRQFAFEERNGVITKQYARDYCIAYHQRLDQMIERRMRQSIHAVASFWYTGWVNAGQPTLRELKHTHFTESEKKEMEKLNAGWRAGNECGNFTHY